MFDIATLTTKRTLELPNTIAAQFQPTDRFIVWVDGDTLHFKRIAHSPLQAVDVAPDETPMSLDEIDTIVHEVRRSRQSAASRS